MSAPDGRHSLSGAVPATRSHRRDVLAAQLDETGRAPAWLAELGDRPARDLADVRRAIRLDRMWQRTGPGRRDRWVTAIAGDLAGRGLRGGVAPGPDGVRIEVAGSAAEIVARERMPKLVPPPAGLFDKLGRAIKADVERTVAEAEQVLGRAVKAAPKVGDSIARYLAQQHSNRTTTRED